MSARGPLQITSGDIRIFTFKEGLLSAIAHDLRLTLKRFRITVNGDDVSAEFNTDTIVVDGAMRDGRLVSGVISDRDREKIRATVSGEVLRTSQFGRATFEGTKREVETGFAVTGTLKLVGKANSVEAVLARRDGGLVCEVELQPSRWGIRPYSALGGTLRLQDRVRVEVFTPLS